MGDGVEIKVEHHIDVRESFFHDVITDDIIMKVPAELWIHLLSDTIDVLENKSNSDLYSILRNVIQSKKDVPPAVYQKLRTAVKSRWHEYDEIMRERFFKAFALVNVDTSELASFDPSQIDPKDLKQNRKPRLYPEII